MLLSGLSTTQDEAEATVNIELLLERLSGLGSTADGAAASELLAQRGLNTAERERLAELVTLAQTASTVTPPREDLRKAR